MKKVYIVVLVLVLMFVVVQQVNAAATGLSIQPVKVSITIEPGVSTSGVIMLTNAGETSINVDVSVEDFIPSAGTTNVEFVGRAEGNTTVRDWITLDVPDQFIFEPGESKSITYTLDAPLDAEPGGHFGVTFFKATKINDQGQLRVGTQVGMLVFVTIPGNQLQKGEVLDFSTQSFVQRGPVQFTIKFENTGTVHFEPKGTIKISNIFGQEVGNVDVSGQAVLPTGIRDLSASWDVDGLLLGRYTAELNIIDGEGNELDTENVVFYAFPLWYFVLILIAILIVFFGLKFLRSKLHINVSLKK